MLRQLWCGDIGSASQLSGSGTVITSGISCCSCRDINGDSAISIWCNGKIISCAATGETAKGTVSKINVGGNKSCDAFAECCCD